MPSPLGHVIGGVAAGWIVTGAPRSRQDLAATWRQTALFGLLGALPDIDLLPGLHRGPTHSIGAVLIVAGIAALSGSRARFVLACALAYGSHILLDWLSQDGNPPIGLQALWPFSRDYYISQWQLFMATSRQYYRGWTFVLHNVRAIGRELAILLPALAAVVMLRPRLRSSSSGEAGSDS
jgi:LexA-binding, inner membrane-associated putative hydrolase